MLKGRMEERYYRLREAMSKGPVASESVACLAHDRWLTEVVGRAGENRSRRM